MLKDFNTYRLNKAMTPYERRKEDEAIYNILKKRGVIDSKGNIPMYYTLSDLRGYTAKLKQHRCVNNEIDSILMDFYSLFESNFALLRVRLKAINTIYINMSNMCDDAKGEKESILKKCKDLGSMRCKLYLIGVLRDLLNRYKVSFDTINEVCNTESVRCGQLYASLIVLFREVEGVVDIHIRKFNDRSIE